MQTVPEFFKEALGIPFAKADQLWTSFQNGIKSLTDAYQGNANVIEAEKYRPNWNLVKDVLDGIKPLITFSKKCPPILIYEE